MKRLLSKTVLVVDDCPDMREYLSFQLEEFGMKVIQASGGKQALTMIKSNLVDLIISDIQMPDGDGFFLLSELKKVSGRHPPFVFVSGGVHLTRSELVERGAIDFVPKPFSQSRLIHALLSAISLSEYQAA